jgi:hypothetical protein
MQDEAGAAAKRAFDQAEQSCRLVAGDEVEPGQQRCAGHSVRILIGGVEHEGGVGKVERIECIWRRCRAAGLRHVQRLAHMEVRQLGEAAAEAPGRDLRRAVDQREACRQRHALVGRAARHHDDRCILDAQEIGQASDGDGQVGRGANRIAHHDRGALVAARELVGKRRSIRTGLINGELVIFERQYIGNIDAGHGRFQRRLLELHSVEGIQILRETA